MAPTMELQGLEVANARSMKRADVRRMEQADPRRNEFIVRLDAGAPILGYVPVNRFLFRINGYAALLQITRSHPSSDHVVSQKIVKRFHII